MPSITMTFEGVFTHLAQSSNPDLGPPYRVNVPASESSNPFGTGIVLGSLSPSVVINGTEHTGPLVIAVSAPAAGAPALPPTESVPSLLGLSAQSEIDTGIAYATFPADDRILLDIAIPATWNMSEQETVLTLQSADITGLSVTLRTSANGSPSPVTLQSTNTLAFTNLPIDPTVPTNQWETLLGFLGVSNEIPDDATPPGGGSFSRTIGGITETWVDPSMPGCSNSQWP